jgi:arginine exporter protein ArgO
MTKIKKNLFITFTLLWIIDALLTVSFITQFGVEMEANPLIRWIISHFGFAGLWIVKITTWYFWFKTNQLYQKKHNKEASYLIDAFLVCIMLAVVVPGAVVAFGW